METYLRRRSRGGPFETICIHNCSCSSLSFIVMTFAFGKGMYDEIEGAE